MEKKIENDQLKTAYDHWSFVSIQQIFFLWAFYKPFNIIAELPSGLECIYASAQ